MSNRVIQVENLSKQYRLGQVGTGSLSHDLNRFWHKLRGKSDPYLKIGESNDRTKIGNSEYVWSLKDINFNVYKGEVLGIIGRNGAGKSTLLKILSKVTSPTTGSIKLKGRVASLLEVGTGFHPELTGRDNIFQNGAILGMSKIEIKKKFDEIVAFSGVERYIDTPVKRYSSGMYVRLAFAVAAHLEPEILIVDEVLAVGDADFQKKCLGKMKEVGGEGRTVLFVSHNMAAVKSLCDRAIMLENGGLTFDGGTNETINRYLKGETGIETRRVFKGKGIENIFSINSMAIQSAGKSIEAPLEEDDQIELTSEIFISDPNPNRLSITYHLNNEIGEPLFSFSNQSEPLAQLKCGKNEITCIFPKSFFQSGSFYLSIFIVLDSKQSIFSERDIFTFTIVDSSRKIGVYMGREPGNIRPIFEWKTQL